MDQLENLLQQKRELERKIKELKDTEIKVGCIRYRVTTHGKHRFEEKRASHSISVLCGFGGKYQSLFFCGSRKETVEELIKLAGCVNEMIGRLNEMEGKP